MKGAYYEVELAVMLARWCFLEQSWRQCTRQEPIDPDRLEFYDLDKNLFANYHPLWRVALNLGTAVDYLGLTFLTASNDEKSPYMALGIVVARSNKGAPHACNHRGLKNV